MNVFSLLKFKNISPKGILLSFKFKICKLASLFYKMIHIFDSKTIFNLLGSFCYLFFIFIFWAQDNRLGGRFLTIIYFPLTFLFIMPLNWFNIIPIILSIFHKNFLKYLTNQYLILCLWSTAISNTLSFKFIISCFYSIWP